MLEPREVYLRAHILRVDYNGWVLIGDSTASGKHVDVELPSLLILSDAD